MLGFFFYGTQWKSAARQSSHSRPKSNWKSISYPFLYLFCTENDVKIKFDILRFTFIHFIKKSFNESRILSDVILIAHVQFCCNSGHITKTCPFSSLAWLNENNILPLFSRFSIHWLYNYIKLFMHIFQSDILQAVPFFEFHSVFIRVKRYW